MPSTNNTKEMTPNTLFAEKKSPFKSLNEAERQVRDKISEMITSSGWEKVIAQIRESQNKGMLDIINHSLENEYLFKKGQQMVSEVARLFRANYFDKQSEEIVDGLDRDLPIVIASNHLGFYKLFPFYLDELGNPLVDQDAANPDQTPFIYPFWAYFAGLWPISQTLDFPLIYSATQSPAQYHRLHEGSGYLHVPKSNGVESISNQLKNVCQSYGNTALVYFPGGTTPGKEEGSDTYHPAKFHTGAYAIAKLAGCSVLPVAQYFDLEEGLKIKVFDSHRISSNAERPELQKLADQDSIVIQKWLDHQLRINQPEVLDKRIEKFGEGSVLV